MECTYTSEIYKGTRFIVEELRREFHAASGIYTHDVLQKLNVIWTVTDFLRIRNDFVDLSRLHKASDDLVGYICSQIDAECERHVMQPHNITKFFAT